MSTSPSEPWIGHQACSRRPLTVRCGTRTDFVITNGLEFFNRPLYGGSSPFRVDGGDLPEFSLYLPGRGGNLRLGVRAANQAKWLHQAQQIIARYRPGAMRYEIRDPLFGAGRLELTVLATRAAEGLVLQATWSGATQPPELLFAFGGLNGQRGRRDRDIGREREPAAEFFQLSPEQCAGNAATLGNGEFTLRGKPGTVRGVIAGAAILKVGQAKNWADVEALFAARNGGGDPAGDHGQRNVSCSEPDLPGHPTNCHPEPQRRGAERLSQDGSPNRPVQAVESRLAVAGSRFAREAQHPSFCLLQAV
jgi:hypothetical protein